MSLDSSSMEEIESRLPWLGELVPEGLSESGSGDLRECLLTLSF